MMVRLHPEQFDRKTKGVTVTIPIPLLSVLLLLAASVLGAFAWWGSGKLKFSSTVCFGIGLFVFGLILAFGKIV